MLDRLRPRESLTPQEVERGMFWMTLDGICSQVMAALTGGAFLVAFALLLGASNTVIGMLAAIGPSAQLLHIPVILLVEKIRLRRILVVCAAVVTRLLWFPIVLVPWFVPPEARVPALLGFMLLHHGLGAIVGCAWNSWIRDLVPPEIRGRYFGRRLAIATVVGAVLSLVAAGAVDNLIERGMPELQLYAIVIALGACAGLTGVLCLVRIPEPQMPAREHESLRSILAAPFRDTNFRQLLKFLGVWGFAVNLAAPFFTVYMLTTLRLPLALVLGFTVLSQLVNALFFGIWGRLADRFSNKSVLTVSGPLFILCIALWPFTSMPDTHALTMPLLVAIHVLVGISTAGVNLCASNIAMELAPNGRATAFLAVNALVTGIAAMSAPIIGGFAADAIGEKELSLVLRWRSTASGGDVLEIPAIDLSGLDFVFIFAVVIGLYAVHRLLAVREEGTVGEKVVITELYAEIRRAMNQISSAGGLRRLTQFPWFDITTMPRRRKPPPTE